MAEYKGIIETNCVEDTPRTGSVNCDKTEGATKQLLITGRNALYPMDKEEFTQGLDGYVAESGALKMWPIKDVVGITMSGGDINAPDLGTFGGARPTNLNVQNDQFQLDAGDCAYKELSKFNKRKVRVFRVDDEGFVYGTVVTRNGVDYFAGFEATVYANRVRTDGSTANNLSFWVYYTPTLEREEKNMNAFEVGQIPDGLIGITLQASATAGEVSVVTACGHEDITSTYGTDWEPSTFINKTGGSPSTATYNESTGALTISPAGEYKVAPAHILAAGNITGLDGVDSYIQIGS